VVLETWPKRPKSHGEIVVFSLNYKSFPIQSGFEQLSRSICWGVLAIQKRGVFQPKLEFVGAEIFTNFCFFYP